MIEVEFEEIRMFLRSEDIFNHMKNPKILQQNELVVTEYGIGKLLEQNGLRDKIELSFGTLHTWKTNFCKLKDCVDTRYGNSFFFQISPIMSKIS